MPTANTVPRTSVRTALHLPPALWDGWKVSRPTRWQRLRCAVLRRRTERADRKQARRDEAAAVVNAEIHRAFDRLGPPPGFGQSGS